MNRKRRAKRQRIRQMKHQEEAPKRRMSPYSPPPPDELSFDHLKCRCGSQPFFAIKNGRLLLRCKQNKCRDVLWSRKDDIYFAECVCPKCNRPTNLLLSLSERNPGKLYYKCHPCGFFKWWHRSLQTMIYDEDRVLNEGASSSASSSASASSSSTSSLSLLGEVFCTVGEMMKRLSLEQEES